MSAKKEIGDLWRGALSKTRLKAQNALQTENRDLEGTTALNVHDAYMLRIDWVLVVPCYVASVRRQTRAFRLRNVQPFPRWDWDEIVDVPSIARSLFVVPRSHTRQSVLRVLNCSLAISMLARI